MKYILLSTLLLFNFSLGGALSTASVPTQTTTNSDMLEKIQTVQQVQQQEQQAQNTQKGTIKVTDYFLKNISFATCTASCPPIQQQFQSDFVTKLDSFSMDTGSVSCTVYNNLDTQQIKPIQKATFVNQKCLKEVTNVQYSSQVSATAEKNNENLSKTVSNSIAISAAKTGNLDLADYITALVTFNPEIIDIQKSLSNQNIEFQNGITFDQLQHTQNKASAIDYARSISSSFFSSLGIPELNPMATPNYTVTTANENEKYLDKFLLFFMETLLVSGDVMGSILWYLFLLSLLWSVIDLGLNLQKQKEDKFYIVKRGLFSLAIIWFFFVPMNSNLVSVQGKNIAIDSSNAQNWYSYVLTEVNSLMDKIVSTTWSIYLSNLSSREGVVSTTAIKSQEKELNQLKIKNAELDKLNQQCFNDYNLTEIKQEVQKLRGDKQQASIFANPFPTVDELQKIRKNENDLLKYGSNPSISLAACYQAKQSILSNQVKIDGYQKNINNFNNPSFLSDKKEQIVALNDYFMSLNQKYGYLSIVFLPAAEMVYGLKDFVEETFTKKWENYKSLDIQAITTGALQQSALLTFLPLDNVIALMSKISSVMPTSWIPFGIGDKVGDLLSLALIIFSVDFIIEAMQYTKVIVFFLVSTYAFLLLFSDYLLTWVKLPFAVIYSLATNQREKIVGIIANVIYISLKVVLIFLAILICLFILFLIDSVSDEFINEIPLLAYEFGFFAWLTTSFMSGFLIILKIILQVAVIIACLHYIPKSFANSLKVEINELSDTVSQVIQQKIK